MFELQSHFIFPVHAVAPAGPLPRGAQALELQAADGVTLRGAFFPAERAGRERVLLLGFAGNAWNAQEAGSYLAELYPACDVVVFHYRGYYPSGGSPSANGLVADAPLIYDFAVARFPHDRVIAVGFSIGCGIAAKLSAKRKLDGLILVTPFDSLKAAAQSLYPWLPIGAFFSHEIDAAKALVNSQAPAAIIAAANDDIIVPERTDALRRRIKSLAFDATIAHAGHNDIYSRSAFHEAMRKALKALID